MKRTWAISRTWIDEEPEAGLGLEGESVTCEAFYACVEMRAMSLTARFGAWRAGKQE
jgi:hypothetical protein